jgi:hypothetical protein
MVTLLLIVMMQRRHQEDSSAFAKAFFSVFKITNLITTDKFSTKKTPHNNGINNSYERQ